MLLLLYCSSIDMYLCEIVLSVRDANRRYEKNASDQDSSHHHFSLSLKISIFFLNMNCDMNF